MGINDNDSRTERYRKLGAWLAPTYDSDTDLPEKDQETIKQKEDYSSQASADQARQSAWDNQGAYPKIKKFFKSAYYGDKRKKD